MSSQPPVACAPPTRPHRPAGRGVTGSAEPADLLAAATVTATRRAGALADAIEARGGAHRYSAAATTTIRRVDLLVLAGVALVCGSAIFLA